MSERRQVLFGVHPVMELLQARPGAVDRVLVARGTDRRLGRLLRAAREAGIPVSHLERAALSRKVGAGARHQGVAAVVAPVSYADPETVCREAARTGRPLVLLDGVTDPRNLGAILRTCAAAGVVGVLLGSEATVGLTPVTLKAAAGAGERIPVAREGRPGHRLASLQRERFTCLALDPRGSVPWDRAPLGGRIIVVAGGEGKGLRPGLLRRCDHRVAIPLAPGVSSLNVAVAVGVVLFEALRQRRASEADLETSPNHW